MIVYCLLFSSSLSSTHHKGSPPPNSPPQSPRFFDSFARLQHHQQQQQHQPCIDLSDAYLQPAQILPYLHRAEHQPRYSRLLLRKVFLTPQQRPGVVHLLQQVLTAYAGSLMRINIAGSHLSGVLFFRGQCFPVVDPDSERVTLEHHSPNLRVIRDDDPPLLRSAEVSPGGGTANFWYVETLATEIPNQQQHPSQPSQRQAVPQNGNGAVEGQPQPQPSQFSFARRYVQLDWLPQLVEVDVSSTKISS